MNSRHVVAATTVPANERNIVPALKDSKTEANLKVAFAGESQANRRYLYFAQKADVEGYPDVAALFRSVAEGETGHAFGHFDFLREVGDPVTGVPVGPTEDNLKSAIEGDLRVHRRCIRALLVPPVTRDSRRSPNGSKRWPAPRRATPDGSPRVGLGRLSDRAAPVPPMPLVPAHRVTREGIR